jgi:hypothetical protein
MAASIKTTGANGSGGAVPVQSVADILERELRTLIGEWFIRVEKEPELTCVPMNFEERSGHLLPLSPSRTRWMRNGGSR